MAPDTDNERKEDAVETQEHLDKIRDAVADDGQAELTSKLNRFEKRVEVVEEKAKTDPLAKAQLEAKLKQAARNFPGTLQRAGGPAAVGGKVGQMLPPGQQGALSFMVGHTKDLKKVVLDFKQPIQFLQFTPEEAFSLSKILRKNAKKCRG